MNPSYKNLLSNSEGIIVRASRRHLDKDIISRIHPTDMRSMSMDIGCIRLARAIVSIMPKRLLKVIVELKGERFSWFHCKIVWAIMNIHEMMSNKSFQAYLEW